MTDLVATPSQTIGPFFRFAMAWMNADPIGASGLGGSGDTDRAGL